MTAYKLDNGLAVPPADKGGRPLDARLAEIDERAARDVISGKFETDSAAAEAYLTEYAKLSIAELRSETNKHKKDDLTKRIKAKRRTLQER